jgi:CheY-like chemotaxis protein
MATILCIDADPAALRTRKKLLEGRGYKVLTAADSAAGIIISRKHSLDVVVLDFKPTVADGDQVADFILRERPDLPVAISSDFPEDIPESLKWFADALLPGRDGVEALLQAVEKLIAISSAKPAPASRGTQNKGTA